jgi:hypothetical protein
MIDAPASSSRPAIRLRTYWPWWTKNFRSSRPLAGVAIAGRRLGDAPQATAEGDVGSLDGVEQQGALGPPALHPQERGVALELRQPERRLQAPDHRLEEVAGDGRRVLDLASGEIRGVSREVGNQEEARFWDGGHVPNPRRWSRSNVKTPDMVWSNPAPLVIRWRVDGALPHCCAFV